MAAQSGPEARRGASWGKGTQTGHELFRARLAMGCMGCMSCMGCMGCRYATLDDAIELQAPTLAAGIMPDSTDLQVRGAVLVMGPNK